MPLRDAKRMVGVLCSHAQRTAKKFPEIGNCPRPQLANTDATLSYLASRETQSIDYTRNFYLRKWRVGCVHIRQFLNLKKR